MSKLTNRKLIRTHELAKKLIVVDGFPGCGKTMLSPILASLDRVEISNYAFEIEFICRMHAFGGVTHDAAVAFIKMLIDGRLYTNMMARDVNFRYSDISSVFNTPQKWRYFKRLFGPGDENIPDLIQRQRPILNFSTHDLCQVAGPFFEALNDRLVFINVVRHPVFMLIQQTLNMERLENEARDIQVKYMHEGKELPYFAAGWEDIFLRCNHTERAIYTMYYQEIARQNILKKYREKLGTSFIEIPFELFVKKPEKFLENIYTVACTKPGKNTSKELRRQRIPRANIVDGIPLAIYKRCGWEVPQKGLTEQGEYAKRRQFAIDQGVSAKCLEILDNICLDYELKHGINI